MRSAVMRFARFALPLAIVAAAPMITPARADEAYICEGGRIVFVKPEELAQMKLTDTCIAGYYGLLPLPAAGAKTPSDKGKAHSAEKAAPNAVPAAGKKAAAAPVPDLKRIEADASSTASKPAKSASAAAPGADFRNVRVLNGAPGTDARFQHRR